MWNRTGTLCISSALLIAVSALGSAASNSRSETSRQSAPSQVRLARDYQSLLKELRANGAAVEVVENGDVSQPFLSVSGRLINVNRESVQVFEYKTRAAAAADSSRIKPDGTTIGTTLVTWTADPHFFKSGRLVVLYVGENQGVRKALQRALGPQFAGR